MLKEKVGYCKIKIMRVQWANIIMKDSYLRDLTEQDCEKIKQLDKKVFSNNKVITKQNFLKNLKEQKQITWY